MKSSLKTASQLERVSALPCEMYGAFLTNSSQRPVFFLRHPIMCGLVVYWLGWWLATREVASSTPGHSAVR